ncbi:MAG: hypothetical protein IAE85_20310 [Anaerolinea sp.]|nr:hypothetical protein [Anaerolinea sp.]
MGPVEVVFLILIGLFGAIGVVRGWQRELGVTTMLLITLFVIEFVLTTSVGQRIESFLTGAGVSQEQLLVIESMAAVGLLLLVTFISYQGLGLVYPGSSKNSLLSLLIGLLNGYLFAGSLWYYLARANWPLANVVPDYSQFYDFFVQILPPAIFGWQFFILLAVAMLILRVVR